MKGTLLATTMRNEGPFILEWVAWYRMLGFDKILIAHNDCTDHSPQLLRLLENSKIITTKKHRPAANEPPQRSAWRTIRNHALTRKCDWLFICDVDEYLVIHRGDGKIDALLEGGQERFRGMAIHWLIFGTAGEEACAHRH